MTNLNPVWKVGFQVREALRANTNGREARRRAVELLADAGMPDPATQAGRYPHQLSGGMCQRALIAIGLAGRPKLLIADEPTSALDVTVQRQVLDHLQQLTDELGTALLLITHDLALAAERAESVVVVHRGVVVESGAARSILREPQHDYTRRLVAAAPSLTVRSRAVARTATEPADDILLASELTRRSTASPAGRLGGEESGERSFAPSTPCRSAFAGPAPWRSPGGRARGSRRWRAWCSACCNRARGQCFSMASGSTGTLRRDRRMAFRAGRSRCSKIRTAVWIPSTRCFAPSRNPCGFTGWATGRSAHRWCTSFLTRWRCLASSVLGDCPASCRVASGNGSR